MNVYKGFLGVVEYICMSVCLGERVWLGWRREGACVTVVAAVVERSAVQEGGRMLVLGVRRVVVLVLVWDGGWW